MSRIAWGYLWRQSLISGTASLEIHVIAVGAELPLPIIPVLAATPPVVIMPVGIVEDVATGSAMIP